MKKRVWKIALICILSILLILYVLFPVGFGIFASIRISRTVGDPPTGFEKLTLTTSDQVKLAAWYSPSKNHAAIILIHGSTASREHIRSYARMLADMGYGVLAFDMRGHGESGGGANAFNWEGTKDVRAAVDFLKKQEGVRTIGGLGLSLGGEILLGALSEVPELKAVVADGASQRSIKDYLIVPSRRNLIHSWTIRVMYAAVRVFTRDTPPITLQESITKGKNAFILLIAAEKGKDEILYNRYFLDAAEGRATLWVVPGMGHTGAFAGARQEYEKRVGDFFKTNLQTSK